MNDPVIVVTCCEPDALPFLRGLPREHLSRATLIATADVIRSAERETPITKTALIGGRSTLEEVRGLLSADRACVTVVVAPDPWGPVRGKGFVRARQVLPFVLPAAGFDVVELDRGGVNGRVWRGADRASFARWIRRREVVLFGGHAVHLGMVGPEGYTHTPAAAALALTRVVVSPLVAAVTLARVLPFIARTEARACRRGESS